MPNPGTVKKLMNLISPGQIDRSLKITPVLKRKPLLLQAEVKIVRKRILCQIINEPVRNNEFIKILTHDVPFELI
jgi:hypothetical protein